MTRFAKPMVGGACGVALTLTAFTGGAPGGQPAEPFAAAELFVEVNATDGDAGLHGKVDGEDWRVVRLNDPDGHELLKIQARGPLKDHGVTEVFFESAEPEFADLSLEEFKDRFPEGDYSFSGTTVDGGSLVGTATLTHDIPQGPVILSPVGDEVVGKAAVEIRWAPVTGVDITGYQVVVTQEEPERTYQVDMPPDATSLRVPEEFLREGLDTKVEVVAREVSGNQTATEVPFQIR